MRSIIGLVLCCFLVGGLTSCQTNKDPFAHPPKALKISAVSGTTALTLTGSISTTQTYQTKSLTDPSVPSQEKVLTAGTKTLDREIILSGQETFEYSLMASEVLTINARSLTEGGVSEIAVETGGVRKVYTTKTNDLIGLMISVGN